MSTKPLFIQLERFLSSKFKVRDKTTFMFYTRKYKMKSQHKMKSQSNIVVAKKKKKVVKMVYTGNRILFGLKTEGKPVICYNMDET